MSLGLLATPTVTICKAAKMVFNVAPGNFYLSQYLEYQEANGTSATVEALANLAGGTDAAFVTTVLTNLGLADDAGAQAFLESAIAASGRGAALEAAITALNNVADDDATYGTAKTTFDSAIVTSVSYSTNTANNSTDTTVLAAAIDPATVAAASNLSLTLTTSTDVLTGGAGDDDFIGSIGTGATLNTADSLDGGDGNDTLTIYSDNAVTIPAGISNIENIFLNDNVHQTIDFSGISGLTAIELDGGNSGTGAAIDITLASGQSLTLDSITDGNVAVDDGAEGEVNITGGSSLTAVTLTVDGVGASTSDLTDLDLDFAGDAIATLNLTASGAASNVAILDSDAALKTVNITASAALEINSLADSVTTVDAENSTAAVDVTIGNADATVTGGAGDDRVDFAASQFTSDDTVDLKGGTDTLAIADTAVSTAGSAALMTAVQATTDVEVLELTTTTAESSLDATDVSSIDSFVLSGAITDAAGADAPTQSAGEAGEAGSAANNQALSITGITAADSFTLNENITGGEGGNGSAAVEGTEAGLAGGNGAAGSIALVLTEDRSGGSDSVTLILSGATITGGAGGNGGAASDGEATNSNGADGGDGANGAMAINASTFETVNIQSITAANAIAGGGGGTAGAAGEADGTGTDGAAGSAGTAAASITVNTNATINVTGDKDLNLGTIAGTNATVNAADFTGKLTVTGEAGNNVITGGSGADIINGGTGQDTLTGGAGADDFVFTLADNVTGGDPNNEVFDEITDFNVGADEIDFSATTLTVETATAAAVAGTASINSEGLASFATADDTLGEKITATEAAIRANAESAGDFAFFEHSGSTYIFVHDGENAAPDAGDALIRLTGVTGLTDSTITGGDLFLA